MSKLAEVQGALPYVIANLPYDVQVKLGYDYSKMIAHCTFNGQKCGRFLLWHQLWFILQNLCDYFREDFVMSVLPGIGNCFTFNHMNGTEHITDRAGSLSGFHTLDDGRIIFAL